MPFLELPKRFHTDFAIPNQQPKCDVRLDTSSFLSKDLELYWDLRGRSVRELVRGAVLDTDPSDIGFGITKDVLETTFVANNDTGIDTGIDESIGDEFSITAFCRYDGSTTTGTEASILSSFVNTAGFAFTFSSNVSAIVESGEYFAVTVTYSDTTNITSYYVNGELFGAVANAGGNLTAIILRYDPGANRLELFTSSTGSTRGPYLIGASAHAGADSWAGGIAFTSIHKRVFTQGEIQRYHRDLFQLLKPANDPHYFFSAVAAVTGALTGTTVPTITEADVVSGGETSIITLTNDTWVAAGATFEAQRQAIINGFDAASSPTNGWNNEVQANEVVTAVVRTSATVVTVTWTAAASYDISSTETITCTIPNAALVTSGSDIIVTPTFTVTAVATGIPIPVAMFNYRRRR